MSYGVGIRLGLDVVLLWLWLRLVATALSGPLGCKPPYAVGAALKRQKTTTTATKKKRKSFTHFDLSLFYFNKDIKIILAN